MGISSVGYGLTVGEAEWGQSAATYGGGRGFTGDSFGGTLTGPTTVTLNAGTAYGDGVMDVLDADTPVTLGRPEVGSRYDAIVVTRDWQAKKTFVEVVTGGVSRMVPHLADEPGVKTQTAAHLVHVPAEGDAVLSDDLRSSWSNLASVTDVKAAALLTVGARFVTPDGHRWAVTPTGVEPEWEPAPPIMPQMPVVAAGTSGITTNQYGSATITHGLGYKPGRVTFRPRLGSSNAAIQVALSAAATGITATTFNVVVKVATVDGWKPYTGNLTWVDWVTHTPPTQVVIPGTVEPEPPQDVTTTTPVTSGGGADQVTVDVGAAPAPQVPIPQTPPVWLVAAPTSSSVAGILATAAAEIGVKESPAGSNKVKYWLAERPSWNGQYWCAAFVCWVMRRNGIAVEKVLRSTDANPYYTPYMEADAKRLGLWYTGTPRPGDLVIYGGSANTKAVHVEIVEKWIAATGRVQTIGGNTSDGLNGSPNNGGGVFRNVRNPRSASLPVRGYIRMPTAVPSNLQARGPFPLPALHYYGLPDPASDKDHDGTIVVDQTAIQQIQAEVGVAVDGKFGAQTDAAVRRWQTAQGRTVNGRVYSGDWEVMQGVYRAPVAPTGVSGVAGPDSITVTFARSPGAQQYTVTTSSGKQATGTSSPITVTGLTSGMPVTATVTATNVGGASPASAATGVLWPTEGDLSTITLLDGTVIPVTEGSSAFGALVGNIVPDQRDATTYQAFTASVPAARFTPAAMQAARNAAAVLYGSTYAGAEGPPSRPSVTWAFTDGAQLASTSTAAARTEWGRGVVGARNAAAWVTREAARLMQSTNPRYGTDQAVTAAVDGLAEYVLVATGTVGRSYRPAGGGTKWDATPMTTAWFFHYVTSQAETASPGFARALNQSVTADGWTTAAIKVANVRGLTVEQLWTEYTSWVSAGN